MRAGRVVRRKGRNVWRGTPETTWGDGGNVYEFAGPHRGEGVAESQQEDLEMPYKRTARTLGDNVHVVNREQEVCRPGRSGHSMATG